MVDICQRSRFWMANCWWLGMWKDWWKFCATVWDIIWTSMLRVVANPPTQWDAIEVDGNHSSYYVLIYLEEFKETRCIILMSKIHCGGPWMIHWGTLTMFKILNEKCCWLGVWIVVKLCAHVWDLYIYLECLMKWSELPNLFEFPSRAR